MDARELYRSWAAQVKQTGGVVTVFPSGPSRGLPAARYTAAQIAQLQRARKLGEPGTWTADRSHGYYLAPPSIAQAARALPEATRAEIARASETLRRSWFGDFGFELGGSLKKLLILGGVGLLAVQLVPLVAREYFASRRTP